MSRKHFVAFANEIKAMENRAHALSAAEVVANVSRTANTNFDTNRFMTACGL